MILILFWLFIEFELVKCNWAWFNLNLGLIILETLSETCSKVKQSLIEGIRIVYNLW